MSQLPFDPLLVSIAAPLALALAIALGLPKRWSVRLAYVAFAIPALMAQPWFGRLLIEADPYRFPHQHVELIRTFGVEVNLANVTPGQVLRLEGFRRGIGRAVDYSIIER